MRILLVISILFSFPLLATDMPPSSIALPQTRTEKLIRQLCNDDFSVREDATQMLADESPVEYVDKFLNLSDRPGTDPETSFRLRSAARRLFLQKVLTQTERYKRLFGLLGFHYSSQYEKCENDDYYNEEMGPHGAFEEHNSGGDENKFVGILVEMVFPLGDADKVLKRWDVIVKIDGRPSREFFYHPLRYQYGIIIADKKYELTVRRYKDIKKIEERGEILSSDKYDLVTLALTAERKRYFLVDAGKVARFKKESWEAYLCLRRDKKAQKALAESGERNDAGGVSPSPVAPSSGRPLPGR